MLQQLPLDKSHHAEHEKRAGRSMPEVVGRWTGVLRFVLSRIDEARQSMDGKGFYGIKAF